MIVLSFLIRFRTSARATTSLNNSNTPSNAIGARNQDNDRAS